MIHVVIHSPVPAMRAGLRALLAAEDGLVVDAGWGLVGEGEFNDLRVAIVTGDGVESVETLPPEVPVLLVQDADALPTAAQHLPAALTGRPAWGVISSEAAGTALRAAVQALAEGLVVLPPDLAQAAIFEPNPGVRPRISGSEETPVEALTAREGDVLRLLAQGLTNRQIAASLKISEHTVKFHVSAIYAKLRVSNRAEAVRTGARWGMVAL